MFTYQRGALSGSQANAATAETGAPTSVWVVTSTLIGVLSPSREASCLAQVLADDFHLAGFFRAAFTGLTARFARPFVFAGNVEVHSSARAIHSFAADGSLMVARGSCTYSLIRRPFIGANTVAPGIARSAVREGSSSRANTCAPNVPANICPFTKAAVCPNIGRTVTRGSFGRSARKSVAVLESAFGIVGRLATSKSSPLAHGGTSQA